LLDDILTRGKSQAYGHGARHLAKLEALSVEIPYWGDIDDHAAYAERGMAANTVFGA